ncbi:hypothetical protein [Mumia zhuanghuii]|uniref:SRPBCC family protein n=1 Tax=Mumia zhuanghuii TaxID=2585211 RepID=A0A5C4MHB0_9ACTN|nr:hypothetical protein [Mumia zhuanghuii]TNC35425.1 hypothetical protein FHE65_27125 [Mumia zhuanghuii]
MKHLPTGRTRRHEDHADIVYTRILPAELAEAWDQAMTTPPFGDENATLLTADPPDHATVRITFAGEEENGEDEAGGEAGEVMDVYLRARDDGSTDLQLVLHEVDATTLGERGPRGDFLLDRLVARMAGEVEPTWGAYYPAGRAYYETLAAGDEE